MGVLLVDFDFRGNRVAPVDRERKKVDDLFDLLEAAELNRELGIWVPATSRAEKERMLADFIERSYS